jgi:hypothetical protein
MPRPPKNKAVPVPEPVPVAAPPSIPAAVVAPAALNLKAPPVIDVGQFIRVRDSVSHSFTSRLISTAAMPCHAPTPSSCPCPPLPSRAAPKTRNTGPDPKSQLVNNTHHACSSTTPSPPPTQFVAHRGRDHGLAASMHHPWCTMQPRILWVAIYSPTSSRRGSSRLCASPVYNFLLLAPCCRQLPHSRTIHRPSLVGHTC